MCSLISFSACDQSAPTAKAKQAEKVLSVDSAAEQPAAGETRLPNIDGVKTAPAIVDGDAINDIGQVVLSTDGPVASDSVAAATGTPELVPSVFEQAAGDPSQLTEELTVAEVQPTPSPIAVAGAEAEPESGTETPVTEPKLPQLPSEANVTTAAERDQKIAADWPQPQAVLFVSGQQHGYIEPCGCTGLENQKGGLIRRDTLLTELRARGWEVVPIDAGNQVRRTGRQPELKFLATVDAFEKMGYKAAALGIDDLKLRSIELIQMAGSDGRNPKPFLSANVLLYQPEFFPSHRIVEAGGRKIGITAILGRELQHEIQSSEIVFFDPVEKLKPVVETLDKEGCDFKVLLAHASLEESADIARKVPGFDLIVTAGGFGEPTLAPEKIDGSTAVMVQVGTKGMYGGIVGLFADPERPIRYQKIAISSQFKDSQRLLADFANYQQKLADEGFDRLGSVAIAHPNGREFVGSEVCGECHTTAFEKWQETPHFHATTSIVEPDNERGGIPRHHDPECVSCHATGWNPQKYYPYKSGFLGLETTPKMTGSGCENCHGPGSEHAAAEFGDIDVTSERLKELQQQMVLPLASAREKCLECHDLDNSPDFHIEGAFDEYWEQVKHYGKD